ncbi:MAG: DUF4351 domain-containing protein [Armatimonadetes bacterium]|nr:DUF4351 domain-containing protein [Armatimonadota bacterium]
MPHDQLWKQLLEAFFREFMELFLPDVARDIDFDSVKPLGAEVFTDLPKGRLRRPDFLVEVRTREGRAEIVLIHVEVQARRRKNVPARMFDYYCLLRLRRDLPVLPVVVYLQPGTGGITHERFTAGLWGRETLRFEYDALGLPDLSAEEYLANPSALAPALSALMRAPGMDRVVRTFRALERVAKTDVDEARRHLLAYVVDHYMKLTEEEAEELQSLTDTSEATEVKQMILSFHTRVHEQALQQGLSQGLSQGLTQGLSTGMTHGEQAVLLRLMRRRFGALDPKVVARVEAIQDTDQLEALADRILDARTLEELGLPNPDGPAATA